MKSAEERSANGPRITSLRRFLIAKLLLWLAGLPVGALITGAFFTLPLGLPTFNLIYVGVFGGYGIVNAILYRIGRVPGTEGRLPFQLRRAPEWTGILLAGAATLIMLGATAAYARMGWFYVFPSTRLLWLALFSIPTALGLWIGANEISMISHAAPDGFGPQIIGLLIGILPFFLYAAMLAALGSVSGLIGSVQGLIVLALVLSFGHLLRRINRIHAVNALCQAVLLYWLILPQGVLFR
jgi:hypothetical protein